MPAPKKGQAVFIVGANGDQLPAEVIDINTDGTIDVKLMHRGQVMTITNSPNDDQGKKPDHWHAQPKPAKPQPANSNSSTTTTTTTPAA